MMHVEDVFSRIKDEKPVTLGDVRKVPFVPESSTLNQVLEAMRNERTQLCVVLDEFGGTEGIITLSDLFHEVAGKIPEEGTSQQGEIHFDKDGRLMVAGTARLDEVGETLKLALEHEEVDTVSGLVLSLLDHLPVTGDKVGYGSLIFEVLEMDGRGVKWCSVTRYGTQSEGADSGG
jgi:CBS domain containing-hemolysin-like protein